MARRSSGEGTIGKRKDGTYFAAIQVEGKRKWVYGKTRKEVADKLAAAKTKLDAGADLSKEQTTVEVFLKRWMEQIIEPRSKLKTIKGYWHIIDLHLIPSIGKVPLGGLKPERVQALLGELRQKGLKPRSVRNVRAVLRQALNWAIKWGYVQVNVATLVELPRIEKPELEPLTIEEVRRFLASVKGHPREALYALAVNLGMRQGELLALYHDDIDLSRRRLRVSGSMVYLRGTLHRQTPKTAASERTLPIPTSVVPVLQAHLARQREAHPDCPYIFSTDDGQPVMPYVLLFEFRSLLKAAGLKKVRFHDLRHTAATLLLADGVPVRTVAGILGHANAALTLNVYGHAVEEQAQAGVDALGERLLL